MGLKLPYLVRLRVYVRIQDCRIRRSVNCFAISPDNASVVVEHDQV